MVAKKITHLHGHLLIADSRDHSTEVAKNDDKKNEMMLPCMAKFRHGGALCAPCAGTLSPMHLWFRQESFLNSIILNTCKFGRDSLNHRSQPRINI